MHWQYDMATLEKQAGRQLSTSLAQQLLNLLDPLLEMKNFFLSMDATNEQKSKAGYLPQDLDNRSR